MSFINFPLQHYISLNNVWPKYSSYLPLMAFSFFFNTIRNYSGNVGCQLRISFGISNPSNLLHKVSVSVHISTLYVAVECKMLKTMSVYHNFSHSLEGSSACSISASENTRKICHHLCDVPVVPPFQSYHCRS